MQRVLVAPDKFKGSLGAAEVVAALAAGLAGMAHLEIQSRPIADGGEGFVEALSTRLEEVPGVCDPLGRRVTARLGWRAADGAGVVGMSEASGMHRLGAGELDPWRASTRGTGELMRHAIQNGAPRLLVGLGGSATNDAGAGMAAALGWEFLTSDGEPIEPRPGNFMAIERIIPPEDIVIPPVVAACDVRNPLLGPHGASRVYARQKGADDRMIEHLEMALGHLCGLVAEQVGIDYRELPGAGAAGGLGYGLATFCAAEIVAGFDVVAEAIGLEALVAASDVVITGEGRFDRQAAYGKGPAEVARMARRHGRRAVLVCGQCEPGVETAELFDFVVALTDLEPSPERCMREGVALLERAGRIVAEWITKRA